MENNYQYTEIFVEEQKKILYRNSLKKDSSSIGILLIITEVFMILSSIISATVMTLSGINLLESSSLELLFSGLVSLVCLFVPGIIYCFIKNLDFSFIFPFSKNNSKDIYLLTTVGLGAALACNYISMLFTFFMNSAGLDPTVDTSFTTSTPFDIVLYFVTVALIPALVEEFLFRGVVLGTLKKYSGALAIVVSGTLFGLLHGNFYQIPFTIPVGIILGYVCIKSNSMLPGIIIHFFNNALSVLYDVLSQNAWFTDNINILIITLITLIAAILGIVSAIIIIKKKTDYFKFSDSDNVIPYREKFRITIQRPSIIIFIAIMMVSSVFTLIANFLVM